MRMDIEAEDCIYLFIYSYFEFMWTIQGPAIPLNIQLGDVWKIFLKRKRAEFFCFSKTRILGSRQRHFKTPGIFITQIDRKTVVFALYYISIFIPPLRHRLSHIRANLQTRVNHLTILNACCWQALFMPSLTLQTSVYGAYSNKVIT